MKTILRAVPLMLLAASARSAGLELAPIALPGLTRVVGQRPAEFRIKAFKVLQEQRRTPLLVGLGDAQFHVSLQYSRDKDRQLVLLKKGGNVHAAAFAASMSLLARSKAPTVVPLGKRLFYVAFDQRSYSIVFSRDAAGASVIQKIAVRDIERAEYEAATPLSTIGVDWRLIYQRELFRAAGMPSFVFMKDTRFGIQAILVEAQGVDRREKIANLPDAKVSLSFDGDDLIVKPVIEEELPF